MAKTSSVLFQTLYLYVIFCSIKGDRYADQLYTDLLYHYQKIVRPVANASEVLTVGFGASLIRIIDVQWNDHHLQWQPEKYGGFTKLHVPSDQIWTPDIVLYNNADGHPDVTIMTDAMVYYDGTVVWKPPAIYKSFCPIDIEYFPYDEQKCDMKFGGWTHNGFYMDMKQIPAYEGDKTVNLRDVKGRLYQYLERGMDLSYFRSSAEWDLVNLTSERHEEIYPGCCGQQMYIDIIFYITLRRKTLFYTVNLVIPCMLIAILTTFIFFLPAQSSSKITLSICILVTLTFLFLVLIDLIPPTSLVIPLFGILFQQNRNEEFLYKSLIYGMPFLSIFTTVVTVNLYNRTGATHSYMPVWMRWLFLEVLPRYLCLKPRYENIDEEPEEEEGSSSISDSQSTPSPATQARRQGSQQQQVPLSELARMRGLDPEVLKRMINNVSFIADHFGSKEVEDEISNDWSYVAMVIDRLFLILFTIVNIGGTIAIVMQAPTLYDRREHLEMPSPTKPMGGDTLTLLSNATQYYNGTL